MTRSLSHRGPDDTGICTYSFTERKFQSTVVKRRLITAQQTSLWMGFKRLSIIDLSKHGRQPMFGPSKKTAIIYNGEIYNHQELRDNLESSGHKFIGSSDTEVLLRLYEVHGIEAMLPLLRGMFAFGIFDGRTQTFHLARDHFGIKPLYVYESGKMFAFASEIKALLAHPAIPVSINNNRLDEYLMFRNVAGEETLFNNIREVSPGTRIEITANESKNYTWWKEEPYEPSDLSLNQSIELFEAELERSVRGQLISDVPVACMLSGGIDSSLIAVNMARNSAEPINCVSALPPDRSTSEEPYIDRVSEYLGARSFKVSLTTDLFFKYLQTATRFMDIPISSESSIGYYASAKFAREQGFTVLLCGEGADETFAGYQRYQRLFTAKPRRLRSVPRFLHSWTRRSDPMDTIISFARHARAEWVEEWFPNFNTDRAFETRRSLFEGSRESNSLESALAYDRKTYLVELLARNDRMTMAASTECRVPFVDHLLVNLSKHFNSNHKVRSWRGILATQSEDNLKIIPKRSLLPMFGRDFVYRRKVGFAMPTKLLLRSDAFAEQWRVYRSDLVRQGILNPDAVDRLYMTVRQADRMTSAYATRAFWTVLAFQVWMSEVVEQNRN